MALPQYLKDNRERILKSADQQIALWNQSYDKYKDVEVVKRIYREFPERNIQRKGVVRLFEKDSYTGFIAAMMWGGINATRPSKNGGAPPFERLLGYSEKKVVSAIEYASTQIESGDPQELFKSFETGDHKLPGVGYAYFTKLFFFLGELKKRIDSKPLIFDKWMANAYCALLIQLMHQKEIDRLPYTTVSLTYKFTVNVPSGKNRRTLYENYLKDMQTWEKELNVPIAKLEEFLFRESLITNRRLDNPRLELWAIIVDHFSSVKDISDNDDSGDSTRSDKQKSKTRDSDGSIEELAPGTRYFPLQEYFRKLKTESCQEITLTTEQIEEIIKHKLPNWAFTRSAGFWGYGGMKVHVQKRSWALQGYKVVAHDISEEVRNGKVTFRLVNSSN